MVGNKLWESPSYETWKFKEYERVINFTSGVICKYGSTWGLSVHHQSIYAQHSLSSHRPKYITFPWNIYQRYTLQHSKIYLDKLRDWASFKWITQSVEDSSKFPLQLILKHSLCKLVLTCLCFQIWSYNLFHTTSFTCHKLFA